MDQSSHKTFETGIEAIEERVVVRDSLFLTAEFTVPGYPDRFKARVRNLSAGGLMAELAVPVEAATPVTLDLRGVGKITGRIAWMAEGRVGVAFDRPIDPRLARKPVVAPNPPRKIARPL